MTSLVAPEVMSSCGRDQALARRRLQQKGDLFNQGGMWKLRWHEDKIGPKRRIHAGLEPGGAHRAVRGSGQAHRKRSAETRLGELPFEARRRSLRAAFGGHDWEFRGTAVPAGPRRSAQEEWEVTL